MTRRHPCRSALSCALGLMPAALSGQSAPSPAADSLRLGGLVEEVLQRNPRLHAVRAGAEAAGLRRPEVSTLSDPMLQLGVMNLGLPEFDADMPSSMAPSVQLTQRVPFPGKLGLKGDIAALDEARAHTAVQEMEWEMRGMAASLFYDLYALDRRIEVMQETLALLRDFQQVAKALYVSGTGRQADVLRADVEVARMDGEIRSMRAMRTAVSARLNALRDLPTDAPLASPSLGRLPLGLPAADSLVAWAVASRPYLTEGRQAVEQARTRTALARREIWPDLTVGVAYGQRASDMGTERMGSAMIGFTLPVFAGRRQHAVRDEALAMERMAAAELGSREAEVGARVEELLAEADRARSLTVLYRDGILPEARATVASALSSYRVGAVDFMTLVDAQMNVNRFEGELHQLLADYGKAVAALESTVGRTLPAGERLVAEAR